MEIFCSKQESGSREPTCDTVDLLPHRKCSTSAPKQTLRFGDFELDVAGYELRRHGRPVRLERQPMDLLVLLVERRRQLVLRTDIVARLWSKDVFVDVETGVNTAVRKIRQALNDSPDASDRSSKRFPAEVIASSRTSRSIRGPDSDPSPVMLAVLPFENLGSDPEREYLADGLTEETIATLGQIDPEHLSVIGRTSTHGLQGHEEVARDDW